MKNQTRTRVGMGIMDERLEAVRSQEVQVLVEAIGECLFYTRYW